MNKLEVLIKGYAKGEPDETIRASSTTVLLESNDKKVLVDPGANEELLLQELESRNIKQDDIDIVFLTHYHLDHILGIRLFPNHDIYDGDTIYTEDTERFFQGKIPGTNIEVIPTPGHASEHVTLLIKVGSEIYAVAQDLFWWMDEEQENGSKEMLINLLDPYAIDKKALVDSRKKVLELADWIIPGHGEVFKVPGK